MRIAFVGLGQMGSAIARTLLAAGYELTVWNRSPEPATALRADGAEVSDSVAGACRGQELVVTMLADDPALEGVADALAGALPRGAVHIAMGTHSVDVIRRLTAVHAEAGQELVAAPAIGRPEVAAAGNLSIVAGGSAPALARCEPLFAAAGRQTFVAGPDPVSAAVIKLANNFALACAVEALAEAFSFAGPVGVPPHTLQGRVRERRVQGIADLLGLRTAHGRRVPRARVRPSFS